VAPTLSLPAVIGHRGAAAHAPENTLAGFRAAAALGVRWVELDAHLLRDGALAVIHDDSLDRTTNGRGRVARHSARRLAMLDAGSWFGPAYACERVPLLDEALQAIAALGMGVNIELKPGRGREKRTAAAVARVLDASPAPPPVLLSSFSSAMVAACRATMPGLPRALVVGRPRRDRVARAVALDCFSLHCAEASLTARAVDRVRAGGLKLVAYTVNDPSRARALWSVGVDAVISDCPDRLLAAAA
jgi:glycerophosphoryl diester phosphodiesterase